LTGVFPNSTDSSSIPGGHLRLVRCTAKGGCGLVQLDQSFDPNSMYGENYGYRSGLNPSMVKHLRKRVQAITSNRTLRDGDLVVDIGSNDGTTLSFYPKHLTRIGIDPISSKFAAHYPPGTTAIPEFFSAESVLAVSEGQKASVITAFSMMYDLDDPVKFVRQVEELLDEFGIFVCEQSYLPLMMEQVAFDTICHEHIEYYGLKQVEWMLAEADLEVVDVEINDVNGGSFAVSAARRGSMTASVRVAELREREAWLWRDAERSFLEFAISSAERARDLRNFLKDCRASGKTVAALGASTKGNVLLQYARLNRDLIAEIGDVNPDKHGRVTPGTDISIVPEKDVLAKNYDFYVVFPWHFRDFFVTSPQFSGRTLVFPLPKLEIVQAGETTANDSSI
jgi:NDP-4-keto-2,6-dideoxyhexose 3-C-methyltransferase